jgi:hypothetical protein
MPAVDPIRSTRAKSPRQRTTIQTTLYDLVAAVAVETDPVDEEVTVVTVRHLLNAYRARFTGHLRGFRVICELDRDRVRSLRTLLPD